MREGATAALGFSTMRSMRISRPPAGSPATMPYLWTWSSGTSCTAMTERPCWRKAVAIWASTGLATLGAHHQVVGQQHGKGLLAHQRLGAKHGVAQAQGAGGWRTKAQSMSLGWMERTSSSNSFLPAASSSASSS